ncbi:MAG: glutamate 5-kinase [Actinomycetaceae bacterium]|nr:glutamate 5-kinase [Actinomycetaceae bacterium]
MAKERVVVKIGSSSLTRPDGGLDLNRIDMVCAAVAAQSRKDKEIIVVTSGSIAAGLGPLGLDTPPSDLSLAQAAASIGQGILMTRWTQAFTLYGKVTGQILLTAPDMMRREHYANARQALERLLALGVVPIVNENDAVATDELRLGDNDRLAALVSHLVTADRLILLTDVDGLYTASPRTPGARLIPKVSSPDELQDISVTTRGSGLGTGGMVTKVIAASMAAANGTKVRVTSADNLVPALGGEDVGTLFTPTGTRRGARRLWLAYAADSQGSIFVDAGAVHAITAGKHSLLAAGVRGYSGPFSAGDVVNILGEDGQIVARGFSGYSQAELEQILAMPDRSLAPRPVVHRDDLAELWPGAKTIVLK